MFSWRGSTACFVSVCRWSVGEYRPGEDVRTGCDFGYVWRVWCVWHMLICVSVCSLFTSIPCTFYLLIMPVPSIVKLTFILFNLLPIAVLLWYRICEIPRNLIFNILCTTIFDIGLCIDPVVYVFFNKHYRTGLIIIIRRLGNTCKKH